MRYLCLACLLLVLSFGVNASDARAESSCVSCHSNSELFDDEGLAIVESFRQDVHAEVGLSCHDCHGGNPDPAAAEDLAMAKDESFSASPFKGVPSRQTIPSFCGTCHSDPAYMKRFKPDIRVDQESEYWTSQHGRALKAGDDNVATCVDCHGIHGIVRAQVPNSPVYPTHIAETCRTCHADPQRMAGYELPTGRPLPIDQYARWRQSVHARALYDKEDLSAPTCNDCHGNHGAAPPGLESIGFVCGQCHGREAELFRASLKRERLEEHNDMLAEAGDEGCAACHEPPEPQAELAPLSSFSECASCHGNHAVQRPTVALFSSLPDIPCAFCHEGPNSLAEQYPEPKRKWRRYAQARDRLLEQASELGLQGDERFDWLVEQSLALDSHVVSGEGESPRLRPEFQRLFDKFRIGKVFYTYESPETGQPTRASVIRCGDCHASEPQLADEPRGLRTASEMVERMHKLTALTARAERILLSARRGGVETREALTSIDAAVDAQIQLEVLVHSFSSEENGLFTKTYHEGLEHAKAGLEAGQEALKELAFRRKGLAIALLFIVLVLIGLGLKIRQLPPTA